jgi:hypothetical protein
MATQKIWSVRVTKTVRSVAEFTVLADSYRDVLKAAEDEADDNPQTKSEPIYDVDHVVQLGEPWTYCWGWYMDRETPSNVLVFERATGNTFTKDDVELLRARIEQTGFKVSESWNGEGVSSVSFACEGRKGFEPLTEDQLSVLLAPRESV